MTEQTDTINDLALSRISQSVEGLNRTSQELFMVMDEQIQAIVSADAERVEKLSEEHSILHGRFKEHEREFVKELEKSLDKIMDDKRKIRLAALKEIYPESATKIEQWKMVLSENTRRLQKKHNQVVDLLEFALARNAKLMHSIYSLGDSKNTHYSPTGGKSEVASGVAVNHQV
ncbi:MAG: flagellar export chaperone FlgN [Balneolaceae bacterium]|nr:flagellar export chaperone FlgN [Balneolaceae bacterium]MCH8547294.1 hypothetical protein [Balneolaceae bacterium]